jgi:SAM-dependent methyltransferase
MGDNAKSITENGEKSKDTDNPAIKKKQRSKKEQEQQKREETIGLGAPYYWESRYKTELEDLIGLVECFDWYVPFDHIYEMIESFLDPELNHRILVVGVGCSNIVECLYSHGFRDITAIDISPTIIDKMQKKYSKLTGVEFLVMDAREMLTLSDNSFTAVIDKAMIDALFCMSDFNDAVGRAYKEIFRVLKPEGLFCSVSHANPLARVPYLRLERWAIDMASLVEGERLTLFTLTKTEDELLLNRKITGAEASIRPPATGIIDNDNQTMNKSSTTRKAGGGGQLTVTSSLEKMMEMVEESGMDGDD